MDEDQRRRDDIHAFEEVVLILERNGRYLEVVGLSPATREVYKRIVSYLKRMSAEEIEHVLRIKRRSGGIRKAYSDPELSDEEMQRLSADEITRILLSKELSRNFLERIAKQRFAMTTGALSVLGSRSALVDKMATLIDHEKTHAAITRAIESDKVR